MSLRLSALLTLSACRTDVLRQPEMTVISQEVGAYGWADYGVTTLQLGEGYGLVNPDGELPRFLVFAPLTPEDRAYPVLLFLHGASADSDEVLELGESGYCGSAYAAETLEGQLRNSALAHMAIDQGWVIAAPENGACDGWVGLGADDPVDPAHIGYAFAELALDWVLYEQQAFAADTARVHVVGSSMGSMGAAFFTTRYPRPLYSAGYAHGATNTLRLYYDEDYAPEDIEEWQVRFDHILGGPPLEDGPDSPPSEWYDRYRDTSLELAVSEGSLTLPAFHLWSDEDPVSTAPAHIDMAAAFEAAYAPAGIPWGDYNSGVHYHSVVHKLGYPFAPLALVRFLDGLSLEVLEGEDGAGDVGAADVGDRWDMSGIGARVADEAGLLYYRSLSPRQGEPLRLTFFLTVEAPATAELRLTGGGETLASTSLGAEDLEWSDRDYPSLQAMLARTTLTLDDPPPELRIEVSTSGGGEVALDVILVDTPP